MNSSPARNRRPIRDYFLKHLLRLRGESLLASLRGVDSRIGFEIDDGNGVLRFLLVLENGGIRTVEEDWLRKPEIVYRTDSQTFFRVVGGRERAETAFLKRKIGIRGNLLKGLKLAFLLQEFFDRFPYCPGAEKEGSDTRTQLESPKDLLPDDLAEEEVFLPSRGTRMKAVYPEAGPVRTRVILLPPHPYLGGSSENRLLLHLASVLASQGVFTVRFDYRVPSKTGDAEVSVKSFWEESDTGDRLGLEDLLSVHDWLNQQDLGTDTGISWVGYSYGAQVCLWGLEHPFPRRLPPDRLVLISPVASQIGHERSSCRGETLLIGGSEDFATSREEFRGFSRSLPVRPHCVYVEGADHFYTEKENEVSSALVTFLGLNESVPGRVRHGGKIA